MNQLDIKCQRQVNEEGGTYYEVAFYIDGRQLLDMIKDFETPFAGKLAGEYSHRYYGDYTPDLLLGRIPEYGKNEDKTALLGCTCGEVGCWPLAMRIRVEGQLVIWDQFKQPFRDWDYSAFGPFEFDLQQYQTVIAKIPQVAT